MQQHRFRVDQVRQVTARVVRVQRVDGLVEGRFVGDVLHRDSKGTVCRGDTEIVTWCQEANNSLSSLFGDIYSYIALQALDDEHNGNSGGVLVLGYVHFHRQGLLQRRVGIASHTVAVLASAYNEAT